MAGDFYTTLGVGPDATAEQIKAAYRTLARQHHPDAGGDAARFAEIAQAYETLGQPERRADYDRDRRIAEAAARLDAARRAGTATPTGYSTRDLVEEMAQAYATKHNVSWATKKTPPPPPPPKKRHWLLRLTTRAWAWLVAKLPSTVAGEPLPRRTALAGVVSLVTTAAFFVFFTEANQPLFGDGAAAWALRTLPVSALAAAALLVVGLATVFAARRFLTDGSRPRRYLSRAAVWVVTAAPSVAVFPAVAVVATFAANIAVIVAGVGLALAVLAAVLAK